jgi:hypothetical protein
MTALGRQAAIIVPTGNTPPGRPRSVSFRRGPAIVGEVATCGEVSCAGPPSVQLHDAEFGQVQLGADSLCHKRASVVHSVECDERAKPGRLLPSTKAWFLASE